MQLSRACIPADDLGPEYVGWAAEWGLRDDAVSIEDTNDDLQQLVDDIVDDVRQWAGRYELSIERELGGDAPADKTIQDMIAETGVVLPAKLPARSPVRP